MVSSQVLVRAHCMRVLTRILESIIPGSLVNYERHSSALLPAKDKAIGRIVEIYRLQVDPDVVDPSQMEVHCSIQPIITPYEAQAALNRIALASGHQPLCLAEHISASLVSHLKRKVILVDHRDEVVLRNCSSSYRTGILWKEK
jgi:hypothetical protein